MQLFGHSNPFHEARYSLFSSQSKGHMKFELCSDRLSRKLAPQHLLILRGLPLYGWVGETQALRLSTHIPSTVATTNPSPRQLVIFMYITRFVVKTKMHFGSIWNVKVRLQVRCDVWVKNVISHVPGSFPKRCKGRRILRPFHLILPWRGQRCMHDHTPHSLHISSAFIQNL